MGLLDRLRSGGSKTRGRTAFAALAAVLVMVSMAAPAVAAGGLAWGDDAKTPNPYAAADTTIDSYQTDWGDSLQYEADDGSVEELPAEVNRSTDVGDLGSGYVNPFHFYVTDLNFSEAGEFPRKGDDDAASALDASEWTTTGASVSDVNTAPSVEAVEFDASASGDQATYSNFSITSDAEKRFVQVFYDVESASGASNVNLTIHDATDGDTATVRLYDADGNTSDDNVGATSTGEGKAMQVQIGQLDVTGGDGMIDEIGKIVVSADGAANVDMSAINMEKTSKWKLGERNVDSDDDDELETEQVYQAQGQLQLDSVDSLGETFADGSIQGLTVPTHFTASELPADDIVREFASDNNYPNWDVIANLYYRIELPSAYDLSYSNVELRDEPTLPDTRYISVETKEASGDTDLTEIDNWNDVTASYDGASEITLDSTVSTGTEYAVHYEVKLTQGEANALQATGGGGAGIFGMGIGGIIGFLTSIPGMLISTVGGFFGFRMLKG